MNYGIEVLVPDGGEHFEAHAVIFELARRDIVRSAIDRDLMSAINQAGGQMLGKCFKPAVTGRNSTCAKYRYPPD